MNKKKYIAPKYKCIKTVEANRLFASSPDGPATPQFLSVGVEDDGVAGVKAHNMWDDEW